MVANVDSPIAGQVARSVAAGFVGQLNAADTALGTYFGLEGRFPEPGEAEHLAIEALSQPVPLALAETTANSKELSSDTFYSAGMAIMFLFLTVQFGVLGLLE